MTLRERYLAAMLFGKPDKIPFQPGGGRESTLKRWHETGLPADVPPHQVMEYAYRQAGGTQEWSHGGEGFWVHERMIPYFEQKVIERKGDSQIVQDWKGNICEISSQYSPDYLLNAIDFVTRRWIKCPVETRADWAEMKKRYQADDPARYPKDPAALGERIRQRTWPVGLSFSGPFWQLREWCGFEGLCLLMADDPAFVEEMAEFWQEHVARLLTNAFRYFTPDEVHLSEDMAYKQFSMISPAMARRFLMPVWKRWGELVRGAGVPVYAIDSDGYIGQLIPLWIEAGVNACDPMEVAAHNDIVAFRRQFGQHIAYRGGVDKRAIAKGGDVIAKELERLRPVVESGGFIPGCDHAMPPDIAWPEVIHYVRLLARLTGWL